MINRYIVAILICYTIKKLSCFTLFLYIMHILFCTKVVMMLFFCSFLFRPIFAALYATFFTHTMRHTKKETVLQYNNE